MTSPLTVTCPQADNLQSANMPPHFTTLPREIRDAILELCLVVGVINPHPWGDRDFVIASTREPDIALLAVNKKINAEGTEIFYGKNVWVINRMFKGEGQRECVSQAPMDEIWHNHRDQIRHVHMALNPEESKVDLWSLVKEMAYQTRTEETTPESLGLGINAIRWRIKFCRELGIKSLTIALPPLPPDFVWERILSLEVICHGCLGPLLEWVRSDEEARIGEPNPASVRSYPKITLTGCPDTMRHVREGWEKTRGPLNHIVNDDWHYLEGFFQPRDAKTIGKT